MTITIRSASPKEPQATALLQASHALMQSLFDPEDNHYLEIDELCIPSIHFFVAEETDDLIGCGALAIKDGYGEVKSMFVDPKGRGKGVAALILQQLTAAAKDAGVPMMKLETGDSLHAAHRLYERDGFQLCGPFGDYVENKSSVFYEKPI